MKHELLDLYNTDGCILSRAPVIPNQINPTRGGTSTQRNIIGEGTSSQNNTIDEGESNSNPGQQTLVFLSPSGLEPSNYCSNRIYESFKSELDPKGVNWKSVSEELKEFYFGEFEAFYWDSLINSEVKIQWHKKAAVRYSDFISVIKKGAIRPKYVPEETWESWMTIWKDPKNIERSKINSRNRRGGENAVAQGTHTGGSITIGEHRKRLAIEKGRDPTPSEIHLHVHTHGHDGKSFIGERARIVHEKYQEILQNQTQSQSDVDQIQAFYQAAGGEKKRRIYGLGSQAKLFYGSNFHASSRSDASPSASASVPSLSTQTAPTDMDEFMKKLIPSLTDHLLPVLAEQVRGLISSPSSQSDTPIEQLSSMVPRVPAPTPASANIVEVHASISEDDRGSPISH